MLKPNDVHSVLKVLAYGKVLSLAASRYPQTSLITPALSYPPSTAVCVQQVIISSHQGNVKNGGGGEVLVALLVSVQPSPHLL